MTPKTASPAMDRPQDETDLRDASTRERLGWLVRGGFAIELVSWRRWVYVASSLYIALFIIATPIGWIPGGGPTIAAIVVLVLAVILDGLICIGPSGVAARARRKHR